MRSDVLAAAGDSAARRAARRRIVSALDRARAAGLGHKLAKYDEAWIEQKLDENANYDDLARNIECFLSKAVDEPRGAGMGEGGLMTKEALEALVADKRLTRRYSSDLPSRGAGDGSTTATRGSDATGADWMRKGPRSRFRIHGIHLNESFDEQVMLASINDRGCEPCEGCAVDGVLSVGMKMCEECHSAFYCGRGCQKKHWARHKPNCRSGIARRYRGEAHFIAAVLWRCVKESYDPDYDATVDSDDPDYESDKYDEVWFPMHVHRDDTVDDLKKQIQQAWNVPIAAQTLLFHPAWHREEESLPPPAEMKKGSLWKLGTLSDFEFTRREHLILETKRPDLMPVAACSDCYTCVGGTCRLEAGPYKDINEILRMAPAPDSDPESASDSEGSAQVVEAQRPFVREDPKPSRNGPCPCGSGRKWKKCCGA